MLVLTYKDRGKRLEIRYIERIDSTHKYLIKQIKDKKIQPNLALYAGVQYDGVGSRGNAWEGCSGNLYLSMCVKKEDLPSDLPIPSISIYFASVFKAELALKGSKIWLKWPNDFFLNNHKIGGLISTKINDVYIISTGINLASSPEKFGILDIKLTACEAVKIFVQAFEKKISWKKVFSNFKVEFQNSRSFTFHEGDTAVSLRDAVLCEDGSIEIENRRVYSLR